MVPLGSGSCSLIRMLSLAKLSSARNRSHQFEGSWGRRRQRNPDCYPREWLEIQPWNKSTHLLLLINLFYYFSNFRSMLNKSINHSINIDTSPLILHMFQCLYLPWQYFLHHKHHKIESHKSVKKCLEKCYCIVAALVIAT